MAAGDILKEALLSVETFTVKASEDIEKGELVCDDGAGAGLVAATAALAVTEKVYMATVAHVYAEATAAGLDHDIECVVSGYVEAQKVAGNDIKKGAKVIVSATAGEADLFVKGNVPTSFDEALLQAALDANAGVIGECTEDCLNADTTMKILIGRA